MPVQPVERKLAAIFAADIAVYSRLMARDEVSTLAPQSQAKIAGKPPEPLEQGEDDEDDLPILTDFLEQSDKADEV